MKLSPEFVQMPESACPTMLAMLKKALDLANRTPGRACEAQSEATKEAILAYEEQEREWIQIYSLNSPPPFEKEGFID